MLDNREFTAEESQQFGAFGRIRDNSSLPWGSRPAIIMLHGRAGNETLMWVFSRVIQEIDPIVIVPRAIEIDPIGGYSWWNLSPLQLEKDAESMSPKVTALNQLAPGISVVSRIIDKVVPNYGVDPTKVIAIGFSQGGALAGAYGLSHPGKLLGVAMLSSFIPQSLMSGFTAGNLNYPKFYMFHGTKDEIITYSRALETKDFLTNSGVDLTFASDDVAHKISSSGMRGFKDWLSLIVS